MFSRSSNIGYYIRFSTPSLFTGSNWNPRFPIKRFEVYSFEIYCYLASVAPLVLLTGELNSICPAEADNLHTTSPIPFDSRIFQRFAKHLVEQRITSTYQLTTGSWFFVSVP